MQPEQTVPTSTTILVIGGGPAGSYAATALAREGFDVTLLEKEIFPRYHIGESMLPSCRPYLKFIDAEDRVRAYGFTVKPGAAVKLNQHKREGYTDFIALNPDNGAWNVVRSEFDELLLRHAQECGVRVCEGVAAIEITFKENDPHRPISVDWRKQDDDETGGSITFEWLVDGSGRAGLMSTKYLKNRRFNKSLRNIAVWGYWRGALCYSPGTDRQNAPWFEALTDESGWAWFIPLHNGTVSVGVVLIETVYKDKKARWQESHGEFEASAFYEKQVELAPGLLKILGDARLKSDIKTAGDYSYFCDTHAGPGFRIIGDAGAFIDPFFSSGVHLAFTGALSAASSIAASIRGQCSELEAIKFHNRKVGSSYTRFLLVVLGIYKQIKAQEIPVMSDINEDNFDRAFNALRPVIQGAADADPAVTEDEVQVTMDFCRNIFAPTDPKMYSEVAKRIPSSLLSPETPILDKNTIEKLAGMDDEVRHVLQEVNARKAIHVMYDARTHFTTEVMDGFCVRMERGRLGLVRA